MKLAEALQERAQLQNKIKDIEFRLGRNATVQEGDAPLEKPEKLQNELDDSLDRLAKLIIYINKANYETSINGVSLLELLVHRDCLRHKVKILSRFIMNASEVIDRDSNSQIRIKSTINVKEKRKDLDRFSKELRLLDSLIQQNDWTIDINIK